MSKQQKKKSPADVQGAALSLRTNIYGYWAELLMLNLIVIFPLYTMNKYIELTGGKAYYIWWSSLVLFAILSLVALTFMGLVKPKSVFASVKTISVPDAAAFSYWLFVVLSAVFSPFSELGFSFFMTGIPEPAGRLDGILSITAYVLIYFAVSRLFIAKERDWMAFAVSACIVALLGILQFMGYDIFELYPYGYSELTIGIYPFNYLDATFRSTLGNVDIVSPYVCIAVAFFLGLYMRSDKKIRFLYLVTAALNFCFMITAGADGGKVGVMAGIALLFVLNITDKRAIARMLFALSMSCLVTIIYNPVLAARDYYNETGMIQNLYWGADWYKSIWAIGALGCLILGLIIYFLPVWLKVKAHIAAIITAVVLVAGAFAGIEFLGSHFSDNYDNVIWQARETMHGNFEDMFGSGRAVLWKDTMNVAFDYPLLGTGPDTFEYAVRDYQEHLISVTNTPFDKAHNDYLQILICNGILGLAAFLILIISLAVLSLPKVWNNMLLMAAIAACGAYVVQAFFGISTPMVTPLFFAMMGLTENLRIGRHKVQYNEKEV